MSSHIAPLSTLVDKNKNMKFNVKDISDPVFVEYIAS